jgi:hypothetical protein
LIEDFVLLICFYFNMALEQSYGHRVSYWIGGGILGFVVCDPQFNFALISFYIFTQSLSLAERLAGFLCFNLRPYYLISQMHNYDIILSWSAFQIGVLIYHELVQQKLTTSQMN